MNWSNLGTITPTLQWQLYDVPIVGTESFRIRSVWTIPPFYRMKAYLGQFFATTEDVTGIRRIYPIKDKSQTIELPIPEDFKRNGQLTRYIGIKLAPRSKLGLYRYDWQVSVDEFVGENPPEGKSGAFILPGQIPGLF